MSVSRLLNETFNGCCEQLKEQSCTTKFPEAFKLALALGHQKTYFDYETFHSIKELSRPDNSIKEMLLRSNSNDIKMRQAFIEVVNSGIASSIDLLIVSQAIKQAKQETKTPITINLHMDSVASPDFWKKIETLMTQEEYNIPLRDITFEILENEIRPHHDFSSVKTLPLFKKINFALDDIDLLNHFDRDYKRLKTFKNIGANICMAKIDGTFIEQSQNKPALLNTVINIIHDTFPDLPILAEWVKSPEQAAALRLQNVSYVQGQDLPDDTSKISLSYI